MKDDTTPDTMTLGKMIEGYIALRDKKAAVKKTQDAVIKQYTDAMREIEEYLQGHLNRQSMQSISTDEGVAFLKTSRKATVADKSLFREYIISSENFDMADLSPSVEAVEAYVRDPANEGRLPPGVNFSTFQSVGVQRK